MFDDIGIPLVLIVLIVCITYSVNQRPFEEELKLEHCHLATTIFSDATKDIKKRAAEKCVE